MVGEICDERSLRKKEGERRFENFHQGFLPVTTSHSVFCFIPVDMDLNTWWSRDLASLVA